MPRRGPKRYRKYSRTFNVTIEPDVAARIMTRGGRSLATFLQDRLGQKGAVKARIHLYRATPGTRLGHIARAERGVQGLGPNTKGAREELLPLTHETAGVLLGDPELGQDISEAYLDEAGPTAVGQRFYYLEVDGGRPSATGSPPGPSAARPRLSETTAAIDLRRKQLILAIYLSEAQAQGIAARLRRKEPIGSTIGALRRIYGGGLRSLATLSGRRRLRIVDEAAEQQFTGEEFIRLPGLQAPTGLVTKLLRRWTRHAIASELDRQRDAFVAAASEPKDGVTVVVTLTEPPGLSTVAQLLRGRIGAGIRGLTDLRALLKAKATGAKLDVVAGFQRA